jgi:hypothetical protein
VPVAVGVAVAPGVAVAVAVGVAVAVAVAIGVAAAAGLIRNPTESNPLPPLLVNGPIVKAPVDPDELSASSPQKMP